MGKLYQPVLQMLLIGILASCSGGSGKPNAVAIGPATVFPAIPNLLGWHPPTDALELTNRIGSALKLKRTGSEFEAEISQHVIIEDTSARFSPEWSESAPSFEDLAFAIYSFNVEGYPVNEVVFVWGEAPLDYDNFWIGLSNWEDQSWDWYPGPASGSLTLPEDGFGDYSKAETGDMLVAVVMLGTDQSLLDTIKVGESAQGDWWMFGHDRQHSRLSPYVGAQTNSIKWTFEMGGKYNPSASVGADGTIYIGCSDGKLYAINDDGTEKWTYTLGESVWGCRSTPAIAVDGTIYLGNDDNKVYAISPDGSLKWTFPTEAGVLISSPNIGPDGAIYIGCKDFKIYAINPDGSLRWSYATGDELYSSPAIGADGTVYVGSLDSKIYAINADGSLYWVVDLGSTDWGVSGSPAIAADGTIYIGSASPDCRLYALNPDGTEKWTYLTEGSVYPSAAIGADGVVYVGSGDGYIYAINADGSPKWRFLTGSFVYSSPTIGADGTIYVGSFDNKMYAINSDGNEKWSYPTGDQIAWSSPTITADGTVIVASTDGFLYAFGPGPGS